MMGRCERNRKRRRGTRDAGHRRKIIALFSVLCSLFSVCHVCHAAPLSGNELIDNAAKYDGKTVTYQGEVIGDIMARGEYVWVNVKDAAAAVGIWAPKDIVRGIVNKGAYNQKGDWIEVKGVFNRSCIEHGGDLDIHAAGIIKLKEGYRAAEQPDRVKIRYAVLFVSILVFISALKLFRKWGQR